MGEAWEKMKTFLKTMTKNYTVRTIVISVIVTLLALAVTLIVIELEIRFFHETRVKRSQTFWILAITMNLMVFSSRIINRLLDLSKNS